MSHDHKEDPIIWEALDDEGNRLSMIVKHTEAEAFAEASRLFGPKLKVVRDTGARQPATKCCSTCGDIPCAKRK